MNPKFKGSKTQRIALFATGSSQRRKKPTCGKYRRSICCLSLTSNLKSQSILKRSSEGEMLGFQIKIVFAPLIHAHRANRRDKGSSILSTKMQSEGMNANLIFMMPVSSQSAHSSRNLLQSTGGRLTLSGEVKELIVLNYLKGFRKETEARENDPKCF